MDLLSIDDLSGTQVEAILDSADAWLSVKRPSSSSAALSGKVVFNLFYENSTRTLMSFATAVHRLGGSAITLPVEQSSVKKGETLEDTARTLNAMQPDVMVVRHSENGAPARVAEIMDCPVINAGDGTNEHPTQALLDAATIRSHFGSIDGLTVAIIGDIRHSRVAHSNALLLPRLGAQVRLAGPPMLMPDDLLPPVSVDEAMDGADVVMMLRVQRERLETELGDAPGEYLRRFGLTAERMAKASPRAVIMHPGPMNRGIEIECSLADDPQRSLITQQVNYGVATRMACLQLLTAES